MSWETVTMVQGRENEVPAQGPGSRDEAEASGMRGGYEGDWIRLSDELEVGDSGGREELRLSTDSGCGDGVNEGTSNADR